MFCPRHWLAVATFHPSSHGLHPLCLLSNHQWAMVFMELINLIDIVGKPEKVVAFVAVVVVALAGLLPWV